jgi:iron-sulfur cluster repair di-iron protein
MPMFLGLKPVRPQLLLGAVVVNFAGVVLTLLEWGVEASVLFVSTEVPAKEILKRLRENSEKAGPDEGAWISTPLGDLTRHIREKHHRHVREAIPRVRALLAKVREKHGGRHPEIEQIEKLFGDVGRDMITHMQKEEQILFPYIDALERSVNGKGSFEPPFFQTVRNPIHAMMKEHDAAGDLVKEIRKATGQYTPPEDAWTSYKDLKPRWSAISPAKKRSRGKSFTSSCIRANSR